MNEETIYEVKGKYKVLTSKGYQARWEVIGYARGNEDNIGDFYRNNRYSEISIQPLEIVNVRGNPKIEELVADNKYRKGAKAA